MDALIELSWRYYPASALIAAGAVATLWGLFREVNGLRRPLRDPSKNIIFISGFRLSIIGLALVGIGAAWLWQSNWLLALSLAIGGEETLETSVVLYALKRHQRLVAAVPAMPRPAVPR